MQLIFYGRKNFPEKVILILAFFFRIETGKSDKRGRKDGWKMNILILNGSPRRYGNTQAVLQKIRELLQIEHHVEILDVCRMELSGCRACDGCKENEGHCVCPDESDEVIQKIAKADSVIFGMPVYWWGMSSQLKMVVDKFYSQDPQFKAMNKKIGLIAIGANDLDDPQYRLIHEQFCCISEYLNWNLAFSLAFSAYEPGEVLEDENLGNTIKEAVGTL